MMTRMSAPRCAALMHMEWTLRHSPRSSRKGLWHLSCYAAARLPRLYAPSSTEHFWRRWDISLPAWVLRTCGRTTFNSTQCGFRRKRSRVSLACAYARVTSCLVHAVGRSRLQLCHVVVENDRMDFVLQLVVGAWRKSRRDRRGKVHALHGDGIVSLLWGRPEACAATNVA
jgi:hypothetical protein